MSKIAVVVVVGYVAYDPSAVRAAAGWLHRQVGGKPQIKDVGSPNYMPVVPAGGL